MPGFVREHEAFGNEVVLEEYPLFHSETSLYHAGVWNMEQAVPRYHVCFTVAAAALAGTLTKRVTVLLSERKSRIFLVDLPHLPVPRLVHATVW